jgi:glycosyltransferase involved in cell wall biosynthesis
MKIWLLNPYGPLPGEAWRETRYAMLGRVLARHGHDVTWWTAGFCHHSKTLRTQLPKDIPVEPGFTIRLVPAPSYRRHVGLARLRFELLFALRVLRAAARAADVQAIVSSDVTMTLALVARYLAHKMDATLVYDIIDLSPEVFSGALPGWLRPRARAVFAPLFALRTWNFRHASGVTAVCDDYLLPAREANPSYREDQLMSVYWSTDLESFDRAQASPLEIPEIVRKYKKNESDVYAIYAGTLGVLYDIDPLLEAAKRLRDELPSLKILVVGGGPRAADIHHFISENRLENLRLLGEMSFTELIRLYQVCDIGLCLYGVDSPVAMPIKIFDYLAAGLPVINSIGGFLERLIREKNLGVQYRAGDGASLAAALRSMSSDIRTLKRMAENARIARAEFDSSLQYGRFANFLETLSGMSGKSGGCALVDEKAQVRLAPTRMLCDCCGVPQSGVDRNER